MKKDILVRLFSLFLLLVATLSLKAQSITDYFTDPLTLPANSNYEIKRMDVKNANGKNLYGVAYIPKSESKQKFPFIILSHGYGSSHIIYTQFAQALVENGIAVYCYDFYGGSMFSKSDGQMSEMSVLTEKSDLESVFAAASKWDFVDTNNIFLGGESQGGFVTAITSVGLQDKLRGLVLFYPAFHIPVTMLKLYPYRNVTSMDFPEFGGNPVSEKYPKEAFDINVSEVCRNFKKDVLIMHGDKDSAVDIRYAFQAQKDYPHATLKILEGADHGFFMPEHVELAKKYMLEFLKTEIK